MIHRYYAAIESSNSNINVVQTQKEMIKASNDISDYLKSIAIPVTDNEAIERVATISSGNAETGKLLAQAFEQAGEYGSVIIEDSKTGFDNLISIQGMKLTNGSVTPYLLNDRISAKSEVIDVRVLVTKDKLDSVSDLLPLLDTVVKQGIKLLIICDDIDFEPLNMILMNKAKGAPLNISIIRLPGFGELRENLVEDICIATGATLMGRDIGLPVKDFQPDYLGEAEQITVTMNDTVIKFKDTSSTGLDLLQDRKNRVEELSLTMNNVEVSQQEQYKRRISNLTSGISVVEVGGNSEVEIKDRKLRIEDAINSVQAAKEEGIVPGGGYSFLMAYQNNKDNEVNFGEGIVYSSLTAVLKQIAENSGLNGEDVLQTCKEKELGYNALTNDYENLVETGVINSAKVDRYSLINATSIASTVITMGGVIVDENSPEQNVLQLQTSNGVML